mgnify:CR=1 FL=1
MAAFPKMTLTNAGQALQTKVLAGETLTFTRIALGDGQLNGQPIAPLTALISQKATVEVDSVRVVTTTTAQAAGFFSNKDISTGFWWRETGLFAQDPDNGEILYGYTNAGDAGDYIPTVEDNRIEKYIFCSIAVANATTVDITIPQSDTFIPMTQKGQAGGVASLDSSGKVPAGQLPEMDFIPDSEKGKANGVATLGADGKLSDGQVPSAEKVSYTNPALSSVSNVAQALDALQEGLENGTITAVQVTAAASGWSGSPPAQSLTVAGMTADSLYWVGLNSTATYAQRDAARKAVIAPTAQGTSSLTLTCDGVTPTVDLPILVFLSGGAS